MKKGLLVFLVIAGSVALCIFWGVGVYNGLVSQEEGVNAAWSQVENTYQRRLDLIDNLVATVKGYAKHEQETLEGVIAARSQAAGVSGGNLSSGKVAEYNRAQGELSSALSRLMVVVERYPDLKANENFLDLQAQLEGTENRIAEARRVFNETAKAYNTAIRRFPASIIAGWFGFEAKGYFEADAAARTAPKVQF